MLKINQTRLKKRFNKLVSKAVKCMSNDVPDYAKAQKFFYKESNCLG